MHALIVVGVDGLADFVGLPLASAFVLASGFALGSQPRLHIRNRHLCWILIASDTPTL
jgi:hypothetical protein